MSVQHAAEVPLVHRGLTDVLFRGPGRSFTVADFLRDTERTASELPDAEHVFNLCQNRYNFAVALAAASLRSQICVLTSDPSPERLRIVADRFGTVCSVGDNPTTASPFHHYQIDLDRLPDHSSSMTSPRLPADRIAAVVFTSGSTGEPIACEKTWGMLVDRSIAGGGRFAMHAQRPASVVGMVHPRHMYGFEVTLLLPLHAACSSWATPLFYPSDVCTALAAVPAPRMLITTPVQLRALLQSDVALPKLDKVISATAPLDPALAADAEHRWGTQVFEIFGATEVGSIASRRTVTDDSWTTYDGVSLEGSQEGPARIISRLGPPGTLSDIIEVLEPTRFRLLGRGSDLVKLAGRRASLAGLNRVLTSIPGVADGVFIVPDDIDHRPTARMQAFVIAPTLSTDDILAELRNRIDPIFLPRRIVRVDALPRNEVGKLPREALLALQPRADEHD
jgi:acyl-coenzyme A synthetase/AMP-(fatty) acid ligase